MFRPVRVRLTLLYMQVGLSFLALVGVGSYALVRGYEERATDLALQHRLVVELDALGRPVPPDLAAADRTWRARLGGASGQVASASPQRPQAAEAAREAEDGQEAAQGRRGATPKTAAGQGRAVTVQAAVGEAGDESAFEETYDGEVAAVFVQPLQADGQPIAGATQSIPSSVIDRAAAERAMAAGIDWRTVTTANGTRVRLLTYRLPATAGPAALQLGRPLADQDRVLRRLLVALLVVGALSEALLGAGGWWLAGRSLVPAEQAWRREQDFVANASHELRTPLTLVRASAEVLARGLPPEGEQRALTDDILAECDHMGQLVGDLLLLSRLDSGRLDVQSQAVDLGALFADLQRQFGRLAADRGVDFDAQAVTATVRADSTRLRQVLIALLDNALHYTPAGGSIRLAARAEGGRTIITVTDTGRGIAPEHLAHVFDRFYRAERSAGESGAGLGLAVAKGLVEAQRGEIRIESQPGRGTTVSIGLPTLTAGPS